MQRRASDHHVNWLGRVVGNAAVALGVAAVMILFHAPTWAWLGMVCGLMTIYNEFDKQEARKAEQIGLLTRMMYALDVLARGERSERESAKQ